MDKVTNIVIGLAFVVFNVPVVVLLVRLPFVADLKQVLQEKNGIGGAGDTTSYSRVTGLVGAVLVTSFFWALGNIILLQAFSQPSQIKPLIDSVGRFFLVGAALFLPYAFNQIRAAIAPGVPDTSGADAGDKAPKAPAQ